MQQIDPLQHITSTTPPAADRRKGERWSILRRVIVLSPKKRYDGYTLDISVGGLSFIASGEIALGPIEVQIPELRCFLKGSVVDSEESDPRRLRRYHMEFITPLDLAEIDRITSI